jgi:hypothetical protein
MGSFNFQVKQRLGQLESSHLFHFCNFEEEYLGLLTKSRKYGTKAIFMQFCGILHGAWVLVIGLAILSAVLLPWLTKDLSF